MDFGEQRGYPLDLVDDDPPRSRCDVNEVLEIFGVCGQANEEIRAEQVDDEGAVAQLLVYEKRLSRGARAEEEEGLLREKRRKIQLPREIVHPELLLIIRIISNRNAGTPTVQSSLAAVSS